MLVYEEKKEEESKKRWAIKLKNNVNDGNAEIWIVDADTGEELTTLLQISPLGRMRVCGAIPENLRVLGYDPNEHNTRWTEYGAFLDLE